MDEGDHSWVMAERQPPKDGYNHPLISRFHTTSRPHSHGHNIHTRLGEPSPWTPSLGSKVQPPAELGRDLVTISIGINVQTGIGIGIPLHNGNGIGTLVLVEH